LRQETRKVTQDRRETEQDTACTQRELTHRHRLGEAQGQDGRSDQLTDCQLQVTQTQTDSD